MFSVLLVVNPVGCYFTSPTCAPQPRLLKFSTASEHPPDADASRDTQQLSDTRAGKGFSIGRGVGCAVVAVVAVPPEGDTRFQWSVWTPFIVPSPCNTPVHQHRNYTSVHVCQQGRLPGARHVAFAHFTDVLHIKTHL